MLMCVVLSVPCSLVVSCKEGLTSWLSCLLCFVTFPNASWSTRSKGEVDAVKLFKPSKGVFFVDHSYFFLLLLCFRARVYIGALWSPAGKGLTSDV